MNDAPAVYAPSDVQGDRSGADRVAAAMARFARDLDRDTALHLDACVRCGHCADACHFYLATGDARYTPIWKLELFRRTYKRTRGPLAWWHRTLGTAEPGIDDLEAWQPLIYDACTMCGRCTLACPMGIDIASLVGLARRAMFDAGLVPDDLFDVAQRAEREGSPLGVTPKVLKERLEWLADEHDVTIRVDEPAADVLVTFSSIEIMKYPASLVAIARILNHAGHAWTISTHGFEATNFGMLSGGIDWQRHATMKLVDAAIACRASTLLMPECGHAYTAMRWHGANWLGRPLPFRVLHVSEFLAENVASGRIRVRRVAASATFHDPCQVSRRAVRSRRRARFCARSASNCGKPRTAAHSPSAAAAVAASSRIAAPTHCAIARSRSRCGRSTRRAPTWPSRAARTAGRRSTTGATFTRGTGAWIACSSSSPSICSLPARDVPGFGSPRISARGGRVSGVLAYLTV